MEGGHWLKRAETALWAQAGKLPTMGLLLSDTPFSGHKRRKDTEIDLDLLPGGRTIDEGPDWGDYDDYELGAGPFLTLPADGLPGRAPSYVRQYNFGPQDTEHFIVNHRLFVVVFSEIYDRRYGWVW